MVKVKKRIYLFLYALSVFSMGLNTVWGARIGSVQGGAWTWPSQGDIVCFTGNGAGQGGGQGRSEIPELCLASIVQGNVSMGSPAELIPGQDGVNNLGDLSIPRRWQSLYLSSSTVIARNPAPSSATVEGTYWNDSTQKTFLYYINGVRNGFEGVLYTSTMTFTDNNSASAVNFTSSTVNSSAIGTSVLPAGWFAPGKSLRITEKGSFSTTQAATNWTFGVSIATMSAGVSQGTTAILNTNTVAANTAQTNSYWEANWIITCSTANSSAGGTGTLIGSASVMYSSGTVPSSMFTMSTTTVNGVAFDAQQSYQILPTFQWSVAASSLTVNNLIIEALN